MALAGRVGRGRTGAVTNPLLRLFGPLSTPERISDLALRHRALRPPALAARAHRRQDHAAPSTGSTSAR